MLYLCWLSMQPAEVIGLVEIPSHIRFWGIDSGIRHRYPAPWMLLINYPATHFTNWHLHVMFIHSKHSFIFSISVFFLIAFTNWLLSLHGCFILFDLRIWHLFILVKETVLWLTTNLSNLYWTWHISCLQIRHYGT